VPPFTNAVKCLQIVFFYRFSGDQTHLRTASGLCKGRRLLKAMVADIIASL
jgi:hypothetical protein